MKVRPFWVRVFAGALFLGIAGVGGWLLTPPPSPGSSASSAGPAPPSLLVEGESVVGEDLTEGEATAWNNAAKLAVDPRGGLHVVYQYAYGKRGDPDRMRYARSGDGRRWEIEEWTGRYPAIAADGEGRVYIAYVERTSEADRLWLRVQDFEGEGRGTRWLVDEGPRRTRAYPALLSGEGRLLLAWEVHEPGAGVHRIRFAEISREGEIAKETVVEGERGVFFPTLATDRSGRIYLAWQATEDARRYRIEVAVREEEGGWRFLGRVAGKNGDGRSPTLTSLTPDEGEGAALAFVSLGPDRESALYRVTLREGRLEPPEEIAQGPLPTEAEAEAESGGGRTAENATGRVPVGYGWASRAPAPSVADYARELVAFPTEAEGLVIWGHTVPNACGIGPLWWAWKGRVQGELFGAFASYPNLQPDPQEEGVYHLVWSDRVADELRAFEVRYARLRIDLDPDP